MISASCNLRNRLRIPSGHRTIFALLETKTPCCATVDAIYEREGVVFLQDNLLLRSPMLKGAVLYCCADFVSVMVKRIEGLRSGRE